MRLGSFVLASLALRLARSRPSVRTRCPRPFGSTSSLDTSAVALTHVLVLDGTGAAPTPDQTILIRDGRIAEVGPAGRVTVPDGVKTMDLSGHTVIPGLVGMHDHLFYTAAGGRAVQMSYTGPRLYLASGVTTIRTAGGRNTYAEINLRDAINKGQVPGPHIHLTAPYITGAAGGGSMDVVTSPDEAKRFVAYWASEGITWIKAYTDIGRAELGAAIKEAHKRKIKVTGHLCSVSFREAVDLGIDNLEHGMLTASDFDPSKQPDVCPVGVVGRNNTVDPTGDVAKATIQTMVKRNVSMTSTLAVYEPFVANRPTKEPRVLNAMAPEVRASYMQVRQEIDSTGSGPDHGRRAQERHGVRAGIRGRGREPGRRSGSDGPRRRPRGVRRSAQLRALHRGRLRAGAGDPDHEPERRQDPGRGGAARQRRAWEARRSGGARRRPHR